MLTGLQVVFVGGDARQLEVIREFHEKDANVTLVGFDLLNHPYENGWRKADLSINILSSADLVILPAVVTDESGKIESLYTNKPLYINDAMLADLPSRLRFYTGYASPAVKEMYAKYSLELVEIFERDDVAIFNSIPTAEGALVMAIENTDRTIHDSNCIVLGMGRTGFTMARVLKGLGAHVKVGVRKSSDFARATECGFRPFYIKNLEQEVSDVDLLFNTVPALIVTAKTILHMPQTTVIIDLASKPGGTDFRFAERRGIKALLAPGLPGIVAPRSAGQIMARCLLELISEFKEKRGNKN